MSGVVAVWNLVLSGVVRMWEQHTVWAGIAGVVIGYLIALAVDVNKVRKDR